MPTNNTYVKTECPSDQKKIAQQGAIVVLPNKGD
jgi:hypothetical protein